MSNLAALPVDLLQNPDFLSTLQKEAKRRACEKSLAEFARQAWHVLEPTTSLKWGWALDAICQHLEAVTKGDIKRLLMNVPPGSMKSLLTGVIWPAWEWGPQGIPSLRYLSTAHKQDLAVRDNLKCRRLIQSEWYQSMWPIELTGDQNAKTKFENDKTGFREAMSFTSMTGSRGDRVILDDPLSVDDAYSDAALESAERTFKEALPTRVNSEESAIVVIMQRLHERDTSGIILSMDLGYEHLCLPMRFEETRRCKTKIGFVDPRSKEGELFFPERFSESTVSELETSLGEYGASGQLQQRPSPAEGGLIKRSWFRILPADEPLPRLVFVLQSYDTAFTEKTTGDPTAHTCWGLFNHKQGKKVVLLDAWSEHLGYPDLRKRIAEDYRAVYGEKDKKVDAVLIEEKGSGISLVQDLRRANIPIRTYNPGRADKVARLHAVAPLLEGGLVYLPESKKRAGGFPTWTDQFVAQLLSFPNGEHDDYVDTMTQALLFFRDSGMLTVDPVQEEEYRPPRERINPYAA